MYEKESYIDSIIYNFLKDKSDRRIIVFCETKREVERIGLSSVVKAKKRTLHGDVKQNVREKVYQDFKKGYFECLIATNVAARGLDFPCIDLVIQMEPPKLTETYIHRSGRTGRAGLKGICVTLYHKKDEFKLKQIGEEAQIKFIKMNVHLNEPTEKKEFKKTSHEPTNDGSRIKYGGKGSRSDSDLDY